MAPIISSLVIIAGLYTAPANGIPWVTFQTAADTAPGDYTGAVRFVSGGVEIARTPLTVHVWDFALPEENHVGAIYDLRMSSRWDIPGKTREEARRDFLSIRASVSTAARGRISRSGMAISTAGASGTTVSSHRT